MAFPCLYILSVATYVHFLHTVYECPRASQLDYRTEQHAELLFLAAVKVFQCFSLLFSPEVHVSTPALFLFSCTVAASAAVHSHFIFISEGETHCYNVPLPTLCPILTLRISLQVQTNLAFVLSLLLASIIFTPYGNDCHSEYIASSLEVKIGFCLNTFAYLKKKTVNCRTVSSL